MDKGTDIKIKQYVKSVASQIAGLSKAYLFGSYVKNSNTVDSDIDIALVIDELQDSERFNMQVQLMMLASQFDSRIEPHPISRSDINSDNPFVYEIMKTGLELNIY